jgi:phosphatidylserine/phosphatidylglycerophosphate/cardiolipin synthase-like enzyme
MSWLIKSQSGALLPDAQTTKYILTDENTFYHRFRQDLAEAKQEVIIESPFITVPKVRSLKVDFERLTRRGIKVYVVTRHPEEHDTLMAEQSEAGIRYFEEIGVQVLLCKSHHRKIAMIDREIVWKGSLNILSHRSSREFMEREEDFEKAKILYKFLKYDRISEDK